MFTHYSRRRIGALLHAQSRQIGCLQGYTFMQPLHGSSSSSSSRLFSSSSSSSSPNSSSSGEEVIGPLQQYKRLCHELKKLQHDEHQERAVVGLNRLHRSVLNLAQEKHNSSGSSHGHGIRGVYLHAGVGRGKTMLMDLFYGGVSAAGIKKQRVHYHEFMLQIHKKLYQNGGVKDPVHKVASEVAAGCNVLCLDELEITDVADAFVTRALFDKLWQLGVVTVFTTNCVPSALYKGGINRDAFLPFIDLIQRHCEVICVDPPQQQEAKAQSGSGSSSSGGNNAVGIDYRQASEPLLGTTFCTSLQQFNDSWKRLREASRRGADGAIDAAVDAEITGRELRITQSRSVTVPLSMHGMCMFSFSQLCTAAIGNIDYLALTDPPRYISPSDPNTGGYIAIFLYNIPVLSTMALNDTRRFINLIDLLYERNILLVMHHVHCVSDSDEAIALAKQTTSTGSVSDASAGSCNSGGAILNEPSDIFRLWLDEISGTATGASQEVTDGQSGKRRLSGHITNVPDNDADRAPPSKDGNGKIEWSSAGYTHPKAMEVATSPTFTHRAIARTLSRLNEMCGAEYVKRWEKTNEKHVKGISLWNV